MRQTPKIAIIGGGIGGLAAAAILSRDFEVQIFEADAQVGGKIRQTKVGDGLIDCGPTVFTMRWVFDDLFERAGSSFERAVTAKPLKVLARHGWQDQSQLDLFADAETSIAAIAEFSSAAEGDRYRAFCHKTEAIFETLHDSFMRNGNPNMAGLMARAGPFDLLATQPFTKLWDYLSRQFKDPRLQQLFARYATYCGSSPYEAPATLMLIAHVERIGVWTLDGGMRALVEALVRLLERNGAEIEVNAPVTRIETESSRARRIHLDDGRVFDADAIVFNGDRAALASGLLGNDATKAGGNALRVPRSQSAITWCVDAEASGFDLSVHNVFFSDAYKEEFDAVFHEACIPDTPTTYIFAPDRDSRPPLPHQTERLFCLINAPAKTERGTFSEDVVARAYDRMGDLLARCGLNLQPVAPSIVPTSPDIFAKRFPATHGALYGMATHGWHASFARPGTRSRVPGLYLAGGSVHPGPGVPMATLSGITAAEAIRKDLATRRPHRASAASETAT